MYNILTLNEISNQGLNLFNKNYHYSSKIEKPDAILVRSSKISSSEIGENLLAIARVGIGVNNIPVNYCNANGIVVLNTPGASANAVNELVIAGIILSSRKIPRGIEWVKTLKGEKNIPSIVEKYKSLFSGPEIKGKKIGIIGLGSIGALVATSALCLEMNVLAYDPYLSVEKSKKLPRGINRVNSLDAIFSECDYITIHVPYSEKTHHMINTEAIDQMQPHVRILNFARAEIVDNVALLDALEKKKILGYVTDFPQEELIDVENVVAIPHLGASTPESEDNCSFMAVKQLIDYLENGNIKNSVNFPSIKLERTGHVRVCISHKNIHGMMNKISGVISKCEINIENIICKSLNELAYSIIDIDRHLPLCALTSLKSIDGIIRMRVIG